MTTTTSTPAATAPSASLWEDFIDIFYAPTGVFERRREGRFFLALVILAVAFGVLVAAGLRPLAPIFDAEIARAMARVTAENPQITADQMAQMRQFSNIGAIFSAAVGFPITILVLGLVLWILGKLFNATTSPAAAIMVVTYAEVPRILEQLLGIAQGYLLDPQSLDSRYSITFSVARFLDPDTASAALVALAGRVDLFTLWVTGLIALGLHVTGRISKGSAFAAAGMIWILGGLPQVLGGLMRGG